METIQPKDGHWGSLVTLDNNETDWTGMVKQLIEKEADLCGSSLTVSEERSKNIDFSVGLLEDITSIAVINPAKLAKGNPTNINLMVFLTVFTKAAWVGILLLALLVAITHIFYSIKKTPSSISVLVISKYFLTGVYDFFLSLIERNEDSRDAARSFSYKIFFLTVSAVCFILLSCYEGDLTASMTVGKPSPRLKSFDDVLKAGYRLHTRPGTFGYDLVANSKKGSALNKIFKRNFETIQWHDFVQSQLQNPSKAAFYGSSFNAEIITDNDFVHLKHFQDIVTSHLAFAFQKDSEFQNIFNYYIIKTVQSGTMKQLQFKWIENDRPSDYSNRIFQDDALSLGYENLFFPMTVMLLGISATAVIFLLEVWRGKRHGSN